MDLQSRLQHFGGPIEAASAEIIAADVARGRRAARRRRTFQTAAVSAFGVAAIVAAISVTGAVTGTPAVPSVAESTAGGVKLVDYVGAQPKYFTIDKVPAGFFVQNDDEGGLTIAPDAAKNPPPDVDPSKAPIYDPRDLGGKIGIYLEPTWYREGNDDGEKVSVGGHQAVIHGIGPTRQLMILVSPEVYATVQADVPLSREQLLELGAGLHVHPEAIERMAAAKPTGGK